MQHSMRFNTIALCIFFLSFAHLAIASSAVAATTLSCANEYNTTVTLHSATDTGGNAVYHICTPQPTPLQFAVHLQFALRSAAQNEVILSRTFPICASREDCMHQLQQGENTEYCLDGQFDVHVPDAFITNSELHVDLLDSSRQSVMRVCPRIADIVTHRDM